MRRPFKTEFLDINGKLIGTLIGEGNLLVNGKSCQKVIYCYDDNVPDIQNVQIHPHRGTARILFSDGSVQEYYITPFSGE